MKQIIQEINTGLIKELNLEFKETPHLQASSYNGIDKYHIPLSIRFETKGEGKSFLVVPQPLDKHDKIHYVISPKSGKLYLISPNKKGEPFNPSTFSEPIKPRVIDNVVYYYIESSKLWFMVIDKKRIGEYTLSKGVDNYEELIKES